MSFDYAFPGRDQSSTRATWVEERGREEKNERKGFVRYRKQSSWLGMKSGWHDVLNGQHVSGACDYCMTISVLNRPCSVLLLVLFWVRKCGMHKYVYECITIQFVRVECRLRCLDCLG